MRAEKAQLTGQVEVLQETNAELHKRLEEASLRSRCDSVEEGAPQEANGGDIEQVKGKSWGVQSDLMEVPRMKRKILQMENELKRTRSKLLNTQSTLKVF